MGPRSDACRLKMHAQPAQPGPTRRRRAFGDVPRATLSETHELAARREATKFHEA